MDSPDTTCTHPMYTCLRHCDFDLQGTIDQLQIVLLPVYIYDRRTINLVNHDSATSGNKLKGVCMDANVQRHSVWIFKEFHFGNRVKAMTVVMILMKTFVHKNPLEIKHCHYDVLSVLHQLCPLMLGGGICDKRKAEWDNLKRHA